MNSLHPCTLSQRAPFAAVRRVSPLCAVFGADCECVRDGTAKANVALTCRQRRKAQVQNAENPRRGGKNPPVWEEPASHLASRRCPGVLPNASNRAEARAHFNENGGNMKKDKQFSIRIAAQDLETIRRKAAQAHMSQSDYVTACCLGKRIMILNGLTEVLRQQKPSETTSTSWQCWQTWARFSSQIWILPCKSLPGSTRLCGSCRREV